MAYSWHKDYHDTMMKPALEKAKGGDVAALWESLKAAHPEHHAKYLLALKRIEEFDGKPAPDDMEEFKKAVKIKRDALLWALDKADAPLLPDEGPRIESVEIHSELLGKKIVLRLSKNPKEDSSYSVEEVLELSKAKGREGLAEMLRQVHKVKEILPGSRVVEVATV